MSYSPYILEALIKEYCPNERKLLYSFLEEDLEAIPFSKNKWEPSLFSFKKFSAKIHYSWWLSSLKTTEEDASLFLPFLPKEVKDHFEKDLLEEINIKDPLMQEFCLQTLAQSLSPLPIPVEFLPDTTMRILLKLTKKQLVYLIDYLALYDLAFELKHIVDTKILKPLFAILDEREKKFVKKLSSSQEPFSLGRIHLEKWNLEEASLRQQLHRKGIFRLSIALHNESKDLLWHIAHRLDIGRGKLLLKGYEQPVAMSISDSIQASIIELIEGENL